MKLIKIEPANPNHCCFECNDKNPTALVEVGEKPDYDSATTWLCPKCVEKAYKLISTPL